MFRLWVAAAVLATAGLAAAQDQANLDELKGRYQDALAQLKAAQDRKNELATENERLQVRVAELEKHLDDAKRQAADIAQQTYTLRCHYAAWQRFIARYPNLLEKWKLFVESNPLSAPAELPEFVEPAPSVLHMEGR